MRDVRAPAVAADRAVDPALDLGLPPGHVGVHPRAGREAGARSRELGEHDVCGGDARVPVPHGARPRQAVVGIVVVRLGVVCRVVCGRGQGEGGGAEVVAERRRAVRAADGRERLGEGGLIVLLGHAVQRLAVLQQLLRVASVGERRGPPRLAAGVPLRALVREGAHRERARRRRPRVRAGIAGVDGVARPVAGQAPVRAPVRLPAVVRGTTDLDVERVVRGVCLPLARKAAAACLHEPVVAPAQRAVHVGCLLGGLEARAVRDGGPGEGPHRQAEGVGGFDPLVLVR